MNWIVAIANQKGGVGKTTTAVNLSASLAVMEKKVLLVDCDAQGNASSGLGIGYNESKNSLYQGITGEIEAKDLIQKTDLKYLDIIAAGNGLVGAELELQNKNNREYYLYRTLKKIREPYDYIILDCPPSLGLLTINAMCAANHLLIPLQCEYYALEGIARLLETYDLIKKRLNHDLKLLGVVLTMFDKRNKLSHQVTAEVRHHFGSKVLRSTIPRNVRLSEAPSHGKPVIAYDIRSTGSHAYLNLAKEVLNIDKEDFARNKRDE